MVAWMVFVVVGIICSCLVLTYWLFKQNEAIIKGIFEIHVTVKAGGAEESDFIEACRAHGFEPVLIELPYGQNPKQYMTSSWVTGTEDDAKRRAEAVQKIMRSEGFQVLRTKIEAGASNYGVPLFKAPSNSSQYFEFHLKVVVEAKEEEKLQCVLKPHKAHLSRSSLKNETGRKFVTLRLYGVGRKQSFAQLASLDRDVSQYFTVISVEKEFCIFDSNERLDRGWIDTK